MSPEATEKVSRVVWELEDERRAVHSCIALQGPLCRHGPRERPRRRSQMEFKDAEPEPAWPCGQSRPSTPSCSPGATALGGVMLPAHLCCHSWPEGCPERERQGTADPPTPPRDAAAQKVSVSLWTARPHSTDRQRRLSCSKGTTPSAAADCPTTSVNSPLAPGRSRTASTGSAPTHPPLPKAEL